MTDDRGVSEVLGYVLVISLVTLTIAMVVTMGIGGLADSQEAEEFNNMERAFDVFSYNTDRMVEQRTPHRATEFRIGSGQMRYDDPINISVSIGGELIDNFSVRSDPIVYEHDNGNKIVYESGAVIRVDDSGSRMLTEPTIVSTDSQFLIHGIRTRPSSGSAHDMQGPGTLLLRKEMIGTDRVFGSAQSSESINISVKSPRAEAWAAFFEDSGFEDVQLSEEEVVVEFTPTEETEVTVLRSVLRITLSE